MGLVCGGAAEVGWGWGGDLPSLCITSRVDQRNAIENGYSTRAETVGHTGFPSGPLALGLSRASTVGNQLL